MQRFDTVAIKATKTDEGFIRDAPVIGRAGILQYMNADGSPRYEYRPPDEAFKADSLATLEGKPITVGHQGMVTAGNAASIKPIGTVLTAGRQDGDAIRADVMIYSLPTKDRELSCGYTLDLEEKPGTAPDGQHFDAVQKNIRYNHIAVVPKGRAGIARLNMDGEQEFSEEEKGKDDESMSMAKVRLDSGLEYDAAPEVGVFIEKMRSDAAEQKKETDKLQAKYDAALADLEKEKKSHLDYQEKQKQAFDAAVKNRVDMLDIAKDHNIDKAENLSDKEIKLAVIKAVRGDALDLTGKSDDYIEAAFDMAKAEKRQASLANQRMKLNQPKGNTEKKHDDAELSPDEALDKLRADEAEAWMKEVR